MLLKYNIEFSLSAIEHNLKRLVNQIYKLLPMREEGKDWQKPLLTIILELVGLKRLFLNLQEDCFLMILSKLEGMLTLTTEQDFALYRRTIFECLSVLGELKRNVNNKRS